MFDSVHVKTASQNSWINFVPTESEARSIGTPTNTNSTIDSNSELPKERRRQLRERKRADLVREYFKDHLFLPTQDSLRAHNEPKYRKKFLDKFWMKDPETGERGSARYLNCTVFPTSELVLNLYGSEHNLSYALQRFITCKRPRQSIS